ncbi:hypothetical protein SAMN05892883_2203 [Jatrophihabitans sp. GAS493]|uniref:hypothetical protein n=1 Tax=Jatrophihabitans sp. GAS493 TaxID=1907575 RepID=UPI000BB7AD3B|nr:hypothetical protein [Jatrophihabitans sp. GAS493]SOD72886.1 hypothetical protein SAMN05892883_2203 [Jatrophihabitans sp. GAS493]
MNAPTPTLTTITRWPQAAGVAWRWARTYSRLRDVWRPLGLIGCPGLWVVNMIMIGRSAADTVVRGAAAAKVPNPITRPPRQLWSALLAPPIGLIVIIGVLVVAPTTTPTAIIAATAAALVLLGLALGMLVEAIWSAATQVRAGRGLRESRADLERETGRPVVVGCMLGAWPQRSGAGGALLDDVRAELAASGVSMIGVARDNELAAKYISKYHARRLDPAHPRIVAWVVEGQAVR